MARRHSQKSSSSGGRKPRPVNRAESKTKRWNKASDIPLDEEDQFHASRDRILLDGDDEQDDEGDDEEVFALKGLDEDEDEENEGTFEENVEDEDDEGMDTLPKPKKKTKAKSKRAQQVSDSEEASDESEEETWGSKKSAYYSSNAAQLESDDEEGNELEEQEANRLQGKLRADMVDDDFGLEDQVEIEQNPEESGDVTPALVEAVPTDCRALIQHLEKTDPETLGLARDWSDTVASLAKTQQKIKDLEHAEHDALSLGMLHLYHQTLLTYTSTLAFYLYLRAHENYAQNPKLLKAHPIISRLLTLKKSLVTLEDFDFAPSDDEFDEDEDEDDEDLFMDDAQQLWAMNRAEGLDPEELRDLYEEALAASSDEPKPKRRKTAVEAPPKKKRKMATGEAASNPIFDLVEPDFASSSKPSSSHARDVDMSDAYGELTSLQHADAADKSARRKSLRFHTSKIESASARRQGARHAAMGGDDDIPYRERRQKKEERLTKEAQARVKHQGGADLNDEEPEPPKSSKKRKSSGDDEEPEAEDLEGYYDLIKRKSTKKKEKKKAEYEAAAATERYFGDDDGDSTGPRSLTRAILSNRGLTPHRPKSVRNPRVKKRQKFEKTKKKISSQKAVYKGGLSQTGGRYEGEKSGISQVVKSIRLS